MKYNDLTDGASYRTDKPVVDFKLKASKKFNQMNYLSLSLGRENTIGDYRDYIDNPIYTTFRNTRTFGSGTLKQNRSDHIRADYSFRNILENLYLITSLSYRKTKRNTLSVSNVSNSGTTGSLANADNNSNMTVLYVNLSKGVRKINTTFYLNTNMIWNKSESVRSSIAVTTKSAIYFISARVLSYQLSDILMISASASYTTQRQTFGGVLPSNRSNSLSFDGKIGIYPIKNLEIYYAFDSSKVKLGENNYKINTFMDAGAIYSFKKLDFELALRNLTNQKNYSYTLYNSLDITYRSFGLRPLEAIFTIKYRF